MGRGRAFSLDVECSLSLSHASARPGGARGARLPGLSAAPANTNAGANSDFNVHIGFTTPADDVKDLTIDLPPGWSATRRRRRSARSHSSTATPAPRPARSAR